MKIFFIGDITVMVEKGSVEYKKIVDLSMRAYDFIRLAFIGVTVLLASFMLIRILPAMRIVLLVVLIVLLIVILIYLLRNHREERRSERDYATTLPGKIKARIKTCTGQIERLKGEVKQIRQSMRELELQLKADSDVPEAMQSRTESVLAGFSQELKLRETKIAFYKQCSQKLEKVLRQHELLAAVERKKEELDNLREKHYDEIADMEELRLEVEREDTYLDTIQELSNRMQQSTGVEEVLHLQKELEKMLAR